MSPSGSAPVILIVGRLARDAKGVRGAPFAAGQRYFQAVARGGGVPLMLPPIAELVDEVPALLRRVDGVALHGGGDIDPRHYGQEATAEQLYGIVPEHDLVELAVVRAALEADVPMLAICRGMQVLNVAMGGTLEQHIGTEAHWFAHHEVPLTPGCKLAEAIGGTTVRAGHCVHHQALDLVADGAWAAALGLLAAEPATRPLLADPVGYTGWWLRRHVRLAGVPLARLRRPADPSFAGLLDECTHPDAAAFAGLLADPERIDADLAQALVDALGDPGRSPDPATVVDVHRRLAGAVTAGRLDPESVRLPNLVRAVTGAVAEPDVAVVVDRPWLAAAIPADRLVVGEPRTATALAALLDLPVASDRIHGRVASVGRPGAWAAAPAAVLAQVFFGIDGGEVVVIHEKLTVRLTGDVSGEVAVGWWVTDDGVVHLQDWLAGHLD